jgi:hypothetical protein
MQNKIGPICRLFAVLNTSYVSYHQGERTGIVGKERQYVIHLAGGKIIETDNLMIVLQQMFT